MASPHRTDFVAEGDVRQARSNCLISSDHYSLTWQEIVVVAALETVFQIKLSPNCFFGKFINTIIFKLILRIVETH